LNPTLKANATGAFFQKSLGFNFLFRKVLRSGVRGARHRLARSVASLYLAQGIPSMSEK
jgi:hypothetical protein